MKPTFKQLIAALAAVGYLSGCTTVTNADVAARSDEVTKQINELRAAQANKPAAPLVQRVRGAYLGSQAINLAYETTLPTVFREVTMRFPGRANLSTVASRITEITKLPVRIRPDVFVSAKSLVNSGTVGNGTQPGTIPGAPVGAPPGMTNAAFNPVPGSPLPAIPRSGSPAMGVAAQMLDDFDLSLPQDYSGSLSGYLDLVASRLGINWEYKDGTIHLYRLVTKVFTVKVNPGSIDFSSTLSKGGSATTGTTGGANATSNGSFSSQSSTTLTGKYSVWDSLEQALNGMKTPLGRITVDQSAGHIIVTDTKEVVEEIGRVIEIENNTLTRQVQVDVRVLRVAFNDSFQAGANLNLVYQRLAAGGAENSFSLSAPGNLVSADAGGMGFNILSPTNRFAGSSLLVQALNSVGRIVDDNTITATTTNRLPVPIGKFNTVTYLARTEPALGGGVVSGGGVGVPGLTPGQVTTGFFLNVIPTALENNSVLMRLSMDQSDLLRIGTISTGSGATLQSIQTPEVSGTKSDHSIGLKEGESLVLMGIAADRMASDSRTGITGHSRQASKSHDVEIIVVTPKVRAGV